MAFLYRAVSENVELFRSRREGIVLISILCLYFQRFYVRNVLAVNYLGVKVHNYLFLYVNIKNKFVRIIFHLDHTSEH